MLFRDLYVNNAAEPVDIRVTDGKFEEIGPNLAPARGRGGVRLRRQAGPAPFVESHVHLDTCLTAGRPRWNLSGTLFEGIQCWEEYKPSSPRRR